MKTPMLNALSFDVEDYYQVEGFAACIRPDEWTAYPPRIVANTRRILDLLRKSETRATFFVLGWIADRFPEVVQEIARGGHELATHGYWHQPLLRQTPNQFSQDLADSIKAIKNALTPLIPHTSYLIPHTSPLIPPPIGYRAPTFSITGETLWAFDILREHGIVYDSSIFPLAGHDRYGIPGSPRFAHLRSGIWEFPIATARIAGRNLPIGGGGYFRLFPLRFTLWGINRVNAEGHPAIFYLHPWELDADQPVIKNASRANRFRHYLNLGTTEKKLASLLKKRRFGPIREVFADRLEESSCVSP